MGIRLIHIVGCRPNFIKLAPVYRAAKDKCEQFIIHTGQHYDYKMSRIFFDELEIPEPNINLQVGSFSPGKQIAMMLERIENGLLEERPENTIVIVYGDTNSTLAGALAAVKLKFPVAHVEASIYAENENNPETINRKMVDAVSNYNFEPWLEESWDIGTGDVMYDQFLWAQDKLKVTDSPCDYHDYVLVTIHREENTEPKRFKQIEKAIDDLNYLVYWPRHPRTKDASPVSYLTMLAKIRDAKFVITDSGGVQKEAFWFNTPCFTVRKQTEWIETVQMGWNKLVEPEEIVDAVKIGLPCEYPWNKKNPYGDGKAAERIIKCLME